MSVLRSYQNKAIEDIRKEIGKGNKKVLLFLATAGGKSVILKHIINSATVKVLFIVRRRGLVFQIDNKHLFHMDTSLLMGSEKKYNKDSQVQICSIDTLSRRITNEKYNYIKDFDLILVDEAHDCTSEIYTHVLDHFKTKIVIGVTASPFHIGNRGHTFWDVCVKPVEMHTLREQGFLVDAKVFAPSKISIKGIKKTGADYNQKDLASAAMSITGDIVATYKKYGNNKTALLFAVTIAHSKMLCDAFNKAGIRAVHIDQSHDKETREKAENDLAEKRINILCNVNIFSTGSDIPSVEIGIMARPTMSESLYIQQIGRLLRPYQVCTCGKEFGTEKVCHRVKYKKEFCTILDHAGNYERHGLPFDVREAQLKNREPRKRAEKKENLFNECEKCFFIFEKKLTVCPACGHEKKVDLEIKHEKGELVEIDEMNSFIRQQQFIMRKYKKDEHWLKKKIFERFGTKCFKLDMDFTNEYKNKLLQQASKCNEGNNANGTGEFSNLSEAMAATRRTF